MNQNIDTNNTNNINSKNLKDKNKDKEIKIKCFDKISIDKIYIDKDCNKLLLNNEIENSKVLLDNPTANEYLYPNLDDPNFNIKIAQKKEFSDTKYDGTIHDIKKYVDSLNNVEFELSPHQAFTRNFMSFQTPYNSLLLYHGLGTGKCHAKGTPIMMYDGNIKLVEDIIEGDLLMGDDSSFRTVLSLARGKDQMYEVKPIKGDSYIVNQEHILCLKNQDNKITEISVKDFLNLPQSNKDGLKGYKVAIEFSKKYCCIDPYLYGLVYLEEYDIIKIHNDYKFNSTNIRLQLLAGIIDSYGIYNSLINQFEIIVKNKILSNDILFIVRSLGLDGYINIEKDFYKIFISGELTKIPCKELKGNIIDQKDALVTGISVKNIGIDDYYGFTLDGNCRYVMGDFTVTHNTCSAIGVAEEMRDYLTQMGIDKKIIIVASPNVQDNFKLQLFDERKLKLVDGIWTIKGCIGNKLLKEINPTNMKGLTKEKVISEVKNLINIYYVFYGYTQFSNKITNIAGDTSEKIKIKNLQQEFNNNLIIIDEVHNMRISDDNENATAAKNLMYLVTVCQNIRLLLLSATPMFNNYKEIIWLINLMNINDKRGFINIKDIFDKDGNFKKNKEGKDLGKDLLIRKITGYISYVRGDNPYTFPFKIYPNIFAPDHTFQNISEYPKYQLNCKVIPDDKKINKISIFLNKIGDYQDYGYKYAMFALRKDKNYLEYQLKDSFGYTDLQIPLECLNIVYPVDDLIELASKIEPCEYNNEEASNPDIQVLDDYTEEDLEEDNNVEDILSEGPLPLSLSSINTLVIDKTNSIIEPSLQTHTVVDSNPSLQTHTVIDSSPNPSLQTHTVIDSSSNPSLQTHTVIDSSPNPSLQTHTVVDSQTLVPTTETKNETKHIFINEEDKDMSTISPLEEPFEIELPIKKNKNKNNKFKKESVFSTNNILELSEPIENNVIIQNVKPLKGGNTIDAKMLTGGTGLYNTMSYIDTITPAQKGSFEYKNVKKYGKIFSPKEIGKYSCKIKSICNSIYNPDTNTVARGIILVYSAYIDAGLIPLALALEEMGFARYQNPKANGKTPSLFKNLPTDIVDVRTMQPLSNSKNNTKNNAKSKNDFKPAKYIMITGDPRLSPNNDLDVKAITSDDNLNGENIKVVLISQAGSEGLDFKAIRQVHIMEPWYNMNRVEQITGRAVRNLSHKDLPFEERNVEIYLHGTILKTAEEEAVDLYVYRVAELKAVQIGKVTRLLKETSVDCIINHEQSEFTNENFSKIDANKNIIQILSDGKTLNNFKIGDMANTAICDYMDTCEYKCLPDISIKEENVNFDSYNETFMLINSDKIIQKIKDLMKERYFYTKKELFAYLNNSKTYPTTQIYSALTQIINDSSEFLLDRYGRTGHLVNIGEYYLFQPSELNYKNISVYERSVPIDYKHNVIKFKIKQEITETEPLVTDRKDINDINDLKDNININESNIKELINNNNQEGKSILDEMIANYDIVKSSVKVTRGEDNWYKYCGVVITKMKQDGIPIELLQDDLIDHMIESLMYKEKIELLNYLNIDCKNFNINTNNNLVNDIFIIKIKKYFCDKIIHANNITAIILFDGPSRVNNLKVYILKNNRWIAAEPEDIRDIIPFINEKFKIRPNLNTFVGFMGYEDKNKYMIFKVKDTTRNRNTGSRCDQAGKKKTIDILNDIIGENKYTKENTRGMVQQELCILQEFLLRNYERDMKNGKTWFLNTEMAVINEF